MLHVAHRIFAPATRGLAQRWSSHRSALLSTLAILEQKDGNLNHGSLSSITAAKKLGGPIHAIVAGSNIQNAAQEAAKIKGVEKVLAVQNGAYDKVWARCTSADVSYI